MRFQTLIDLSGDDETEASSQGSSSPTSLSSEAQSRSPSIVIDDDNQSTSSFLTVDSQSQRASSLMIDAAVNAGHDEGFSSTTPTSHSECINSCVELRHDLENDLLIISDSDYFAMYTPPLSSQPRSADCHNGSALSPRIPRQNAQARKNPRTGAFADVEDSEMVVEMEILSSLSSPVPSRTTKKRAYGNIEASQASMSREKDHSALKLRVRGASNDDDRMTDEEVNAYMASLNINRHKRGFKAGDSVELDDGNFLRVQSVVPGRHGRIDLEGLLLVSVLKKDGTKMSEKPNELIWVNDLTETEFTLGMTSKFITVSVDKARKKRTIIFTNQRYPNISLEDCGEEFHSSFESANRGPLFCRWKSVTVSTRAKVTLEESIAQLTYEEADPGRYQLETSTLRWLWRGLETKRGGSYLAKKKRAVINIDNDINSRSNLVHAEIQNYTFGDAFCGAGGASRGASQAGFHVAWGFDIDIAAWKSYSDNFSAGGAECLNLAVDHFLAKRRIDDYICDVLHLSPPCQPWSAAHTISSPINDEKNQAVLFAPQQLLESIKPRIATLEETEGLLSRHRGHFDALMRIFLDLGYSVRWKIVKCKDYGVPQIRKRIFIIAAGPGEKLPQFAKPTHGEPGTGLRKFTTIRDMISRIPRDAAHHNTSGNFRYGPKAPFSADGDAKTMTTSGGVGNYHPSGLRNYSVREYACLQTFPITHSFADNCMTAAKKQVGNAVPPKLGRAMYREIIKSLKETDQKSY